MTETEKQPTVPPYCTIVPSVENSQQKGEGWGK